MWSTGETKLLRQIPIAPPSALPRLLLRIVYATQWAGPWSRDDSTPSGKECLDPLKQFRQGRPQSFGNSLNVYKREIAYTPFHAAVIRPVQAAPVRSLFLIDPLLLADAIIYLVFGRGRTQL